jgi:predicted outer membrane repeat protein
VTSATFTGNEAQYGGAIANDDYATVDRSDYTKNAAEYGGGLYNDEDSYLAVTGSGFYQNEAAAGGGIDNAGCDCDCDDSDLLVTGGAFTGNAAEYVGGGIYNNDDATVSDVTFRLNTAPWGGGIYIDDETGDTTFALTGGTFTGNTAPLAGGAIFNNNDSSVDGATFLLNTAEWGGAIYNWHDNTLTFTDSQITRNTATGGGGGIYNQDDGTVTLTTTSVVSNNPDNCEPLNTISDCTD